MTSPLRDPELLERLRAATGLIKAVRDHSGSELQLQRELRDQYPAELVRAAFALQDMRRRAAGKFPQAEGLWGDRVALEQATPPAVAAYKASRFPVDQPVTDLCCGMGSDAIALARRGPVLAIDRDPACCLWTKWNRELLLPAVPLQTEVADVRNLDLPGRLVHIDPDRRSQGRRVRRIEQYEPDLAWLQSLPDVAHGGAIKLSPASNFGGKFDDCEVELISLDGECKEATVWFGDLQSDAPFRATGLPSGETIAGHPMDTLAGITPLGEWLHDPDPAIVRSGLIGLLCDQHGFTRLDAEEEYLTSDHPSPSALAHSFRVDAVLPNNDRQVRQHVRDRGYGSLEIKCRRVPVDADRLRKKLPLGDGPPGVLLFCRIEGRTRAVFATRVKI